MQRRALEDPQEARVGLIDPDCQGATEVLGVGARNRELVDRQGKAENSAPTRSSVCRRLLPPTKSRASSTTKPRKPAAELRLDCVLIGALACVPNSDIEFLESYHGRVSLSHQVITRS